MIFQSTRGDEKKLSGAKAIIKGIADDKGLYAPVEIPKLPLLPKDMVGMTYEEVAKKILLAFFDDFTEEEMERCVLGAYSKGFDSAEIAPIVHVGDKAVLELYHGRTAAFKDMALSILPHLLTTALEKEGEKKKICILTATSGDTGKAALEGFADVEGTEIIVFYPEDGVSTVQKRQMITQQGKNVHVYAIRGNFDNAQSGVKEIFNDEKFNLAMEKNNVRLSSANSINIGRLVPQVAYYVFSYVKLIEAGKIKAGDEINIAVPTGNFGNILAGYYAAKMGIPINKFICASNENKVLTDFFNTGKYDIKRDFILTNSPSMDILISSNLERLLFLLSDNDSGEVARLMSALEEENEYKISDGLKDKMSDFYGGYATEEEVKNTIEKVYREYEYLMDTHTAIAYKVYEDYVKESGDERQALIVSTASPYKFSESVAEAIGMESMENPYELLVKLSEETGIAIPEGLMDLDKKEVRHSEVIDVESMKDAVVEALNI